MAVEKFNLGKFFSGFLSPVSWAKDIKTIVTIAIVIFVGFTLYRAYIQPRTVQKQQPKITVQSGGTGNFNFSQVANKERRWFIGPTLGLTTSKPRAYYVGITIMRSF
jgi:hypothetical protein